MSSEYLSLKLILLQFVLGWVIFDRTLTELYRTVINKVMTCV